MLREGNRWAVCTAYPAMTELATGLNFRPIGRPNGINQLFQPALKQIGNFVQLHVQQFEHPRNGHHRF